MDFCNRMVNHLLIKEIEKPNHEDVILSPLSINVILNMIVAGMTGRTLKRMLRKLNSASLEEINRKSSKILAVLTTIDNGPIVTSINGVWIDKNCQLKASYEELLKRVYNCGANKTCDFMNEEYKVRQEINSWADAASKGLIESVIEDKLDPTTKFVRANALYFKGEWSKAFDPRSTQPEQFHLLNGTIIQVPFMQCSGHYDYGSFEGYKVLRVPYRSGLKTSFSMHFFLPDKKNGLPDLLETFNSDPKNLFVKSDLERTDFDVVKIPKVKFSYGCDFTEIMGKMGLYIPHKGNKLDYAGMVQNPENLPPEFVTTIIQKAFLEIDEYGTEASAVTVSSGFRGCAKFIKKPNFVADHPFMFAIMDDISGLVLFTGVVLKPKESGKMNEQPIPQIRKRKRTPPL